MSTTEESKEAALSAAADARAAAEDQRDQAANEQRKTAQEKLDAQTADELKRKLHEANEQIQLLSSTIEQKNAAEQLRIKEYREERELANLKAELADSASRMFGDIDGFVTLAKGLFTFQTDDAGNTIARDSSGRFATLDTVGRAVLTAYPEYVRSTNLDDKSRAKQGLPPISKESLRAEGGDKAVQAYIREFGLAAFENLALKGSAPLASWTKLENLTAAEYASLSSEDKAELELSCTNAILAQSTTRL